MGPRPTRTKRGDERPRHGASPRLACAHTRGEERRKEGAWESEGRIEKEGRRTSGIDAAWLTRQGAGHVRGHVDRRNEGCDGKNLRTKARHTCLGKVQERHARLSRSKELLLFGRGSRRRARFHFDDQPKQGETKLERSMPTDATSSPKERKRT